jgi:cell wall-associated NlpC family hydrolase
MIVRFLVLLLALCVAACSTTPVAREKSTMTARSSEQNAAEEVVMFSFGLLETKYRFGGRNPEAGLDCSGLVSYVFERAAGMRLTGTARDIARKGRLIAREDMKPGDLVFFNTRGFPHSHVGIYLGNGRFIHAPSSKGQARVRTDSLTEGYFARRFVEARTYFY